MQPIRAYKPRPNHDPWRRLIAKVVERAVMDLYSTSPAENQPTLHQATAAIFLVDETVRSLCDAMEIHLPWRKIYALAQLHRGEKPLKVQGREGQ